VLFILKLIGHFLRLLTVWWPGTQSERDNHLLACNFAKYYFFSLADSAKTFVNLVIDYSTTH